MALQKEKGQVHLSRQDAQLTEMSLQTLAHLMTLPEVAQAMIKLGLPSLLNDIAQCQHFASPGGAISQIGGPGALLSCIYYICEAEWGKEHLTQHVNADSMLTLLELLLSWMELPSFVQKPMLGTDILDSCPAVGMLIILLYCVVDSRFSGVCRNAAGETSCCWPGCLSTTCISCRKCRFCFSTPGNVMQQ